MAPADVAIPQTDSAFENFSEAVRVSSVPPAPANPGSNSFCLSYAVREQGLTFVIG